MTKKLFTIVIFLSLLLVSLFYLAWIGKINISSPGQDILELLGTGEELLEKELQNLLNKGTEFFYDSNYSGALETWKQGQQRAKQNSQYLLALKYQALFSSKLGTTYDSLGQYDQAKTYFQDLLDIYRELKNSKGKENTVTQMVDLMYHSNISVMYRNIGQYERALKHFQYTLDRVKDARGKAHIFTDMGIMYRQQRQYQKALKQFQKAKYLYTENHDSYGIGEVLTQIGIVYLHLKQYQNALEQFEAALELIKNSKGKGDVFTQMGIVHSRLQNYEQAQTYFKQATNLYRHGDIKDRIGESNVYTQVGLMHLNRKQYHQALESFDQALETNIEINNLHGQWQNRLNIALTYQYLERYQQVFSGIEQALGTWELDEDKPFSFVQDLSHIYDELINQLQQLHRRHPDKGYGRTALETFERKQKRIFLSQLIKEKVTDPKLRRKILQTQGESVTLDELQASLQTGEMLLVYNVMTKNTLLWLIDQEHFEWFTLNLTDQQIRQQIDDFYQQAIQTMHQAFEQMTSEESSEDSEEEDSKELKSATQEKYLQKATGNSLRQLVHSNHKFYQQLFPNQVRQRLARIKPNRLYVVPTESLYDMPFEVLVTQIRYRAPRYLIQDYAIAYLPSASWLKTLRETQRHRSQNHDKPKPLLAKNESLSQSTHCGISLEDSFFFSAVPKAYSLQQTNTCVAELPSSLTELFKLEINADLITLSTNNQDPNTGGGVHSLTQAFMSTGTPATSVNFWPVEFSIPEKSLDQQFFSQITNEQSLIEHLQQAKLMMLQEKVYNHPYFWGGVVMFGVAD